VHYLEERNFLILKGDEPLNKMIEYFYNAEVIIGYHGSLFANTIFCQSFVRVLEFCADNRRDFSFYTKYKIAKNYTHELIEADDKFNANLDLDVIKNFLKI
jgi:capsular polysaccharide biosynthesis protein